MSEPLLGVTVSETRLHPIYLIIGTAKTLRQAIPFLVVTIFGGAPWWVNAGLFVMVMAIAIAQWHVKKYSVLGGMFQLRSGLINRSVRVVPVTRITTLATFQSLTQRLVGVWGLDLQSPGDHHGSTVTLECLSGSRLDELRAALETGERIAVAAEPKPGHGQRVGPSTFRRYLIWRHTSVDSAPGHGQEVIAVLTTVEMMIAAVTDSSFGLILVAVLVVWFRFSEYVPARASKFMDEIVEPQGVVAVLITLVVVAIVAGVVLGAFRLYRFTLVRDGGVLRSSRGLLGKQTATIPVERVQAVRVAEGFWRMLLGYCSLQVEVAGIGRIDINRRTLFPFVRTDRAESLIREALPELPWPSQPLLVLPARVHRRYLTVPLEYAVGGTLLMLLLPGWWEMLAILPVPLGFALGTARAREARWRVDDQSVVLRWRRLLNRNTVIAYRSSPQLTELSSSPWKAKAGVAGFKMRFSSGRAACIHYMVDSDALLLLHTVGSKDARHR